MDISTINPLELIRVLGFFCVNGLIVFVFACGLVKVICEIFQFFFKE